MSDQPSHRDPAELAALYVSGAMTPQQRRDVEGQLAAGDQELAREVARLEVVVRGLAETSKPLDPDPATREALLAHAAGRPSDPETHAGPRAPVWRDWKSDRETPDLFTLRADEGEWDETGVEGIQVRRLFVDRANNRMTALFKMAPGSAYVPHVHDGPEECYVLQGDLRVGDDLVMHGGDYQRAPAGSVHGVQRTETGCLLLVTSSLHDQPV